MEEQPPGVSHHLRQPGDAVTRAKPKLTRAQRRQKARAFMEWFLLPFIVRAARNTGVRGRIIQTSMVLSEVETRKELRHLIDGETVRIRALEAATREPKR